MVGATGFGVQSWLITPAAGVASAPPPPIQDQKWLLFLSGVAVVDFKGANASGWTKEIADIRPDLTAPLKHAITKYRIPTPIPPVTFFRAFQVDLVAPFGALSSIFNQGQSVNAGYAIDAWRTNPFASAANAFTGARIHRIFDGIQLDLGVRDKEAVIHRVSYNIALLGRIVFGRDDIIP